MIIGIIIGSVIALASIAYSIFQNTRSRRLLISLDDMIDDAIKGHILKSYNDTLTSAIEHKLIKYISITEAERKRLADDREHVRTLISDISHQTKTSVASIKIYCSLMNEQSSCDEILLHSERLEFLISALVKMSRLETGVYQMKKESVPADELISAALSAFYLKAVKKGIIVTTECDSAILLYCDKKWTAEAIGNVIENAIKYSVQNEAKIIIRVRKLEMYTCIIVEDNGIGIDIKEINEIFKRFFRGKKSVHEEGTGIGLYISREIMNRQGGYITASVNDELTAFTFFIPNQI